MRFLPILLVTLLVAIQYPLWLGKGSWLRVWDIDRQLTAQTEANTKLQARNSAMDAEVRDLKQGYEAIEERARSELGMIKHDEVFFQLPQDAAARAPAASERSANPAR